MFRLQRWLIVLATVCLTVSPLSVATAKTYHQKSSALSVGRKRTLNDRQVHYVTAPKKYAHAAHPHGRNIMKSSRGAAVTFKTWYQLPLPGYHGQAWGNPQSVETSGRYLYVLYCPTAWHNRGRIVRYDLQKLKQTGLSATQLQTIYLAHVGAKLAAQAAVKVGPAFVTGHGQSLAYNGHNHQLYLWCDREKKAATPINQYGYINQINPKTLKTRYQIRFRLKTRHFAVPGGHVLAFDRRGRAYFWSRPTSQTVYIYQGSVSWHHVYFRLTHQVLKHGPGSHVQSMGYNPHTNRLYLVADGSIASLPISKLAGKGHLTSRQVRWTRLASKREFEGLTFTKQGRAIVLSNHNPEVLMGNRTAW